MGRSQQLLRPVGSAWALRDEFNDPRSAGTIHDTYATDGKNKHYVVDTENKLSIVDGLLTCAGGKASPAWGDPGLWYEPAITRAVGVMVAFRKFAVGNTMQFGLGNNKSGPISTSTSFQCTGSALGCVIAGTTSTVATFVLSTQYDFLIITRATGSLFYWKLSGASQWTFLWPSALSSVATLYAGVSNYSAAFTLDRILRPLTTWMPTPRVSHGFSVLSPSDGAGHAETSGLGAGGDGVAFAGATWSVSGGAAVNTPVAGGELVTNGDMETGDPPSSWASASANLSQAVDERTGGSGTKSLNMAATANLGGATQVITAPIGWYRFDGWLKKTVGTGYIAWGISGVVTFAISTASSWTQRGPYTRLLSAANPTLVILLATSGDEGRADDISVKPVTLSTLFIPQQTPMADANVFASIDLTIVTGNPAGVALVNDPANPTAGIVAVHNGTNAILYKFTDPTTWTALINTAATYSAGKSVRFSYDSTTGACRLYYNDALIGTQQTITDAEIVACRYIAAFNTGGGSSVDNLVARNLFETIPGV